MKFVAFGAVGGLAWAAALRAYMAEIAGRQSGFDWVGTELQILLPGILIGAILGLAEAIRRAGGRRGWRWLALAPLLFFVAPMLSPGAFEVLIETGIGGGALAIPLFAMAGGFALSGRGPIWARILGGLVAAAGTVGAAVAASVIQPRSLALTEPRGVWVALLFASLMVVFMVACSLPHRPVVVPTGQLRGGVGGGR